MGKPGCCPQASTTRGPPRSTYFVKKLQGKTAFVVLNVFKIKKVTCLKISLNLVCSKQKLKTSEKLKNYFFWTCLIALSHDNGETRNCGAVSCAIVQ